MTKLRVWYHQTGIAIVSENDGKICICGRHLNDFLSVALHLNRI